MPCDPRQPGEIAEATQRWIRANVPGAVDAVWEAPLEPADSGTTTYIWFGRLRGADLPDRFREPLALRVYGDLKDDETLELERSILDFVAAHGYPVPAPLAAVASGSENPVGLPWMVQPRVPGVPLLAVIGKAPWAARARLRELAALQACLHAMPGDECPLPAVGELVDRWFAQRGPDIEGLGNARANAVFDALHRRADVVRDEERVVCHGDFHPLNVLSSRRAREWHHVVIDWTEAVVGDRHYDVARTLALFRVAAIAASSPVERMALRAAAPALVRSYRHAYERAHPLDGNRLTYWTAAHLLRGWAQITRLHDGEYATTRANTDAIPLSVADVVLSRAERAMASLV